MVILVMKYYGFSDTKAKQVPNIQKYTSLKRLFIVNSLTAELRLFNENFSSKSGLAQKR